MKNEIEKYKEDELVVFSINIEQKNKNITFPFGWQKFTLNSTYIMKNIMELHCRLGK